MSNIDIDRLQRLFTQKDLHRIEDVLFYRDVDGSFVLFEQYRISKNNEQYLVFKYGQQIEHKFSTLKWATCWCINSRRNKITTINEIIALDRKLSSLDVDIRIQRNLLNSVEDDFYRTKLSESLLHRAAVLKRLEQHVHDCDRWQNTKFGRSLNLVDK